MTFESATRCDLFDDLASIATERLDIAYLGAQQNIISISRFGDGRLDRARAPLRIILGDAIRLNAQAIVIAHNHPSGVAAPSLTDCTFTRSLAQITKALEISLFDHLIYARNDRFSFRDAGLL